MTLDGSSAFEKGKKQTPPQHKNLNHINSFELSTSKFLLRVIGAQSPLDLENFFFFFFQKNFWKKKNLKSAETPPDHSLSPFGINNTLGGYF